MIALVDVENTTIYLYTENGLEVYKGSQISEFSYKYSGMNMMYITQAIDTVAEEVASIFGDIGIGENSYAAVTPSDPVKQKTYFLHSSTDKTMIIKIGEKNITDSKGVSKTEDVSVIFRGKSDCKVLDETTSKLIENNFVMKDLIRKKQLEIIDEDGMRRVLKDNEKKQKKRQDLQKKKDQALDSIIVKDSRAGAALDVASGMSGDDDDIERLDITDDVKNPGRSLEDLDPDDMPLDKLNKLKSGGFA